MHQSLRSWPKLFKLSKTQSAKMYQMDAVNQNGKNPIDVYGVKCPNIEQSDSK